MCDTLTNGKLTKAEMEHVSVGTKHGPGSLLHCF